MTGLIEDLYRNVFLIAKSLKNALCSIDKSIREVTCKSLKCLRKKRYERIEGRFTKTLDLSKTRPVAQLKCPLPHLKTRESCRVSFLPNGRGPSVERATRSHQMYSVKLNSENPVMQDNG